MGAIEYGAGWGTDGDEEREESLGFSEIELRTV